MNSVSPPPNIAVLLERCHEMAGKSLGRLADELNTSVPENLLRHKGWVGQLLENYLGADAGSYAEPDFTGLGVEMKTLPLNQMGMPKESTYVCTLNTDNLEDLRWENSWVCRKLSHVLWVPIEADNAIPLAERFIGQAWLWRPSESEEATLKKDWEDIMDRVIGGELAQLNGKEGEFLHIRPKAADSKVMMKFHDNEGLTQQTNPKGFYLRTNFTRELLAKAHY